MEFQWDKEANAISAYSVMMLTALVESPPNVCLENPKTNLKIIYRKNKMQTNTSYYNNIAGSLT